MAFRSFAALVTVLLCLNFRDVKALECSKYCSVDCREEYKHRFGYRDNKWEEELAHCLAANAVCDCTTFNKILGLVLGVTLFAVIVGLIGCYCICRQIKQLNPSAGAPGGAIYQPSPSRVNYGYQPAGAGPPHPLSYATPAGAGPKPLTYTNPPYPTIGSSMPPNEGP